MSKTIMHGKEARDLVLKGVNFLADAVCITEGPRGRNIILGQRGLGQSPKCTRDGVTVSNYADPSNPTMQMGADLVREAAQRTDNAVGDGTTASIVLSRAMIQKGFKLIDAQANPMAMERGMRKASDAVIKQLQKTAIEVDYKKICQVATVSAHGDQEIGDLVAKAVDMAGKNGIVSAEPSSTSSTYIDSVAGLELDKSNLIHQSFITHPEEMKAEHINCRILLWEGVIATAKSVVPILKQMNEDPNHSPLLIVAGGYEAEALSCIIKNKVTLALPLIAVRLEAYGDRRKEVMRDIAALIGGSAYTEDLGSKIENVKLIELGMARKVITNMSKTQIIEGRGNQEQLAGRVEYIKTCIESAAPLEKAILRTRLAALLGGITIIKVGGVTVTEMEERKDRVVDAMSAAKAAVDSGIVAGGGTAILRASEVIAAMYKRSDISKEEEYGLDVIHDACESIAMQIAVNAGLSGSKMIDQLRASPDMGYNALTGKFENLIESGIIDPVRVVCESLKNATAVACSIITMGATISENLEKPNV